VLGQDPAQQAQGQIATGGAASPVLGQGAQSMIDEIGERAGPFLIGVLTIAHRRADAPAVITAVAVGLLLAGLAAIKIAGYYISSLHLFVTALAFGADKFLAMRLAVAAMIAQRPLLPGKRQTALRQRITLLGFSALSLNFSCPRPAASKERRSRSR
jgi:hypothetical protein